MNELSEQACLDPGDFCRVIVHGLDYPGRVVEVRLRIGLTTYQVEYVANGAFENREFLADEVRAMEADDDRG
jgi:hypothetical protein